MQDNDLKNLKSKDKGSKSRSQSMDEQSHYKQDKTITRQSINVKRHIFNVIGDTEKFEERDLNIGGDMDIFAFIHTPDPTKLPLIVLKATVERLFDEGGSGNQTEQVDSAGGGKDADIQPVIKTADTVVEDVAPVQPRRQGKRKFMIVDAGGASHPP
ncbi:hypothetical protein Tco_1250464, partial [Tanacetum coccineum]